MNVSEIEQQVNRDGFAIVKDVVPVETVAALQSAVEKVIDENGLRSGSAYGTRSLLEKVAAVRELACSASLRKIVETILGRDCFAVRGIWFDKVESANWKVPWHQDLSIAVRERRDVEGFGAWTRKEGVVHAHAPTELLERMVTLRLHLDDCDETNGPVRVLPGTHHVGKLTAEQIQTRRTEIAEVACVVPAGGVLVMRPLLLHASSPAQSPRHRRVVHLEYTADCLPDGLEWQSQVKPDANSLSFRLKSPSPGALRGKERVSTSGRPE